MKMIIRDVFVQTFRQFSLKNPVLRFLNPRIASGPNKV